MSEEKEPIKVGATFPRGQLTKLSGSLPSFAMPLTVVEFWEPDEDEGHRRYKQLHEHQRKLRDLVEVVALTSEDADDLPTPSPGLNWVQVDEALKDGLLGALGLPFSMIFDRNRRLLWRGSRASLDGTLLLLAQRKLTPEALVDLGRLRQRYDALEAAFRDDDVDQADTCKLALAILDRNPADTEVLDSALDTAQSFELKEHFWALVERVRPEYLAPDDALDLAASLIDSSTLHLRAPRAALKLVEHHRNAPFDRGDPLVRGAEVYAFLGDFPEALRWLTRATEIDPDDEDIPAALAVMRERAELAATRRR
jgi:tetratricopeptide (TPR) repeat protein